MADHRTLLQRLWTLGCSLKLAIYAASAATLLIMGGSLVMAGHPEIFAGMDGNVIVAGSQTGCAEHRLARADEKCCTTSLKELTPTLSAGT